MSLVTSRNWADESDVRRLNILYELLAALSRATGLEEVYDAALTSLLAATSADRAAILLFDDDGVIRFKAWRGLSPEYRAAVTGHTPWQRGLLAAAPIVTQDVLSDESLRAYHDILTREGIRGLCFIPLALASGIFGEFMLYYSKPNECAAEDITLAEAIAAHVALATERKQIEEAAQRTERRFQAILDNAAAVIFLKDLEGRYQLVNRRFEELFHIKKDDVLGKTDTELFSPEFASRFRENDEMVLKSVAPLLVEEYAPHDDGLHSYISMKFPLKEADGTVSGVGGLATDITDRKRAEEEREVLLGREQDARRIAQLLNQVGPRLATQLDFKHLVQDVTDMATALVGAEFGSFFHNVVNQKGESYMLYTLSGVSPDAFAGFPMPRNTALFGPTYRGEGVVRCDDVTKDPRYGKSSPHYGMPKGHLPVCSYLAAPVLSRTGEVLGGLFFGHSCPGRFTENQEAILLGIASQAGIAMDNARLFQQAEWAQLELKRSNEELQRVNQDLETFAYSASHDLQEPLRTIALCSQMLDRRIGGSLTSEDASFLKTVITSARRMTTLVQDLLAYTKATKHPEGRPPSIDPAPVLASTLDVLRGPIEAANATITSEKLPLVSVHESRLSQLFQNLISNALKYRSDETPRINICAEDRDGWCVFSVTDNGIGIEMEFAKQIFQIFKRLHLRDEYEGSGMGLAVCQRIVEQYGGRIWLEKSAVGKGSTFCFTVPSSRPEELPPPEAFAH